MDTAANHTQPGGTNNDMYECNYCDGSGKVDKNGNPASSAVAYGRFYLCPLCKGEGKTQQPVYAFDRHDNDE